MGESQMLTTIEAGERLGISRWQVRLLIQQGRLPATKTGRDWFVKESDLKLVKDRPKGRPVGAKDSRPRKTAKK